MSLGSANAPDPTLSGPIPTSGGSIRSLPGGTDTPAMRAAYVVLTGNPNCGKTTLFNALTGLRAKVGNYAGVTVERKEGKLLGAHSGTRNETHGQDARATGDIRVLDLPGTYSLSPN